MNFALVISAAPYSSQAPQSAFFTAQAILAQGHAISRVFLYGDGVLLANTLATPPRDEENWTRRWSELIQENALPATACIASALRRGVLDEAEARRHEQPASNLAPGWTMAGLGDWVEAEMTADRVLFFTASH
ncbi:MAG: sulfurtransferase complex subunit TusD [Oleiphilaceae bacterium]|nr:sulfurtransferase complex subunit TusD [Oleiphilaceae bacterium]